MDVTRVSVLGDGVRPGVVISVRVVEEEEAAAEEVAAEEVVVMGRHSQPGQDVVGFTKAVGTKPGAHDTGHTGGGHPNKQHTIRTQMPQLNRRATDRDT